MEGMSGKNMISNGRFEDNDERVKPWTGVDQFGNLRKSVAMRGTNPYVDQSNRFDYAFMANSASFIDMDGDGLSDIVAPDGAGFFWFWKNIGRRGAPAFGFGEIMPLLVDNERSRFQSIPGMESAARQLSRSELSRKERIDERRERELESLRRRNQREDPENQWTDEELLEQVEDAFPYPWANDEEAVGTTMAKFNAYRQLRAIAAPCDWDRNGTLDFIVGDSDGNLYRCLNSGTRSNPNFRTFTKSKDGMVLKLVLDYNPIERKNEYKPIPFMNYAAPFVVDWNGNGKPDLLVGEGTYSTNAIRLYLDPPLSNADGATFPEERALYVGEERTFLVPAAWDWDGDGFLDLIVTDQSGRITIHPNPGGKFRNGTQEMTQSINVEMEGDERGFHTFTAPQPCDWNADGIMDLIWSGPFGRIFYSLGQEKGGPGFGPPVAVKSVKSDEVERFQFPEELGLAAVPAYHMKILQRNPSKGGTADGRRYITAGRHNIFNEGGWPDQEVWYGLHPTWEPERTFERLTEMLAEGNFSQDRFYWAGSAPSFAIAPVPYEVFKLVEEGPSPERGEGDFTLVQSWHDPRENAVFNQSRDEPTRFGQGVSIAFQPKEGRKSEVKDEKIHNDNVRVSFYMKLEGDFSLMTVVYGSSVWLSDIRKKGQGGAIIFEKMETPPTGKWFHYESIAPAIDKPRISGRLAIHLHGRGEVYLRDVAVADTKRRPTK
jgi:hypothetical protein